MQNTYMCLHHCTGHTGMDILTMTLPDSVHVAFAFEIRCVTAQEGFTVGLLLAPQGHSCQAHTGVAVVLHSTASCSQKQR